MSVTVAHLVIAGAVAASAVLTAVTGVIALLNRKAIGKIEVLVNGRLEQLLAERTERRP